MNVQWQTEVHAHCSGVFWHDWTELSLRVLDFDRVQPTIHIQYMFKGDAIALELHTICGKCGLWHSHKLSRADTYHHSQLGRLERNLCEKCFAHFSCSSRKGLIPAPLSLSINLQIHETEGWGRIDIRGEKGAPPLCPLTTPARFHRSFNWPSSVSTPILELLFTCPVCHCEQVAASTEKLGPFPRNWLCSQCGWEHRANWAFQRSAVAKDRICFFCDRPVLDIETVRAEDPRFNRKGFVHCLMCQRIKKWTQTWCIYRTISRTADLPLPPVILLEILGFLAGQCREGTYKPSATRLLLWKRIPLCRTPLDLDYRFDSIAFEAEPCLI